MHRIVAVAVAAFAAGLIAATAINPAGAQLALTYVQNLSPADAVQISPGGLGGPAKYVRLSQLRDFILAGAH